MSLCTLVASPYESPFTGTCDHEATHFAICSDGVFDLFHYVPKGLRQFGSRLTSFKAIQGVVLCPRGTLFILCQRLACLRTDNPQTQTRNAGHITGGDAEVEHQIDDGNEGDGTRLHLPVEALNRALENKIILILLDGEIQRREHLGRTKI